MYMVWYCGLRNAHTHDACKLKVLFDFNCMVHTKVILILWLSEMRARIWDVFAAICGSVGCGGDANNVFAIPELC